MNPFRQRTLRWLIGGTLVSFLLALFWGIFGSDVSPQSSPHANAYSRSAIGHHALVALLRELRIPTVVSRFNSAAKAGDRALLIIAEPTELEARRDTRDLARMVDRAQRALLVLPKWRALEDDEHKEFIRDAGLRSGDEIGAVLEALGLSGGVTRPGADVPLRWSLSEVFPVPTIEGVQLIDSVDLNPIVSCNEGILIGQSRDHDSLYVLSDPDVLSNHGLGRGDNAVFCLRMIGLMRDEGEAVVIDETAHGFAREPSVFRAAFEFPLLIATLAGVLTLMVLLWATFGRFGAPQPPRPVIEPGKGFLIDNIATLLHFGRHSGHALTRYLRGAVRDVSQGLHAPTRLGARETRAWLDEIGTARGVRDTLAVLEDEVSSAPRERRDLLKLAQRVCRWREEMLHGSGART